MKQKRVIVLWLLALICCVSSVMVACSDDDEKGKANESVSTIDFNVNLDPTDYSLATIFSPQGDSIFIFGDKDETGLPVLMRDVIINPHDGDGPTEISLNEEGNPTKVTTPNGVVMLFEWIDTRKAALTLLDPNSEEQLNTFIDFDKSTDTKNSRSVNAQFVRTGKTQMSVTPLANIKKSKDISTRSGTNGEKRGNLSIKQCNVSTNSECWVDAYSYSGMPHSGLGKYMGRLKCINIGKGEYQYMLPQGVVGEHHDLAEHCDLVMGILSGICQVSNTLGPAYKNAICLQISAGIAAGGISVPVALGFEAACVTLNYSLEIFCHTTGMQAATWGDSFTGADALCAVVKEMHLEWDDPLLFVPTVSALPSDITGIPKSWEGTGSLPNLEVNWGSQPQISQFNLNPAAPTEGQGYVATADLYCLPAGAIITLSIVGTDGYTNANVFVVGDEINYSATLYVPGAASGVKDICTIKLELPDGSVKTKKASLVFQ